MELDYAEEHTMQIAIQNGSVIAHVCRDGDECEEGAVLLGFYERMASRGLLKLTRMSGSRFSPDGGEYVEFVPTEAGAALIAARGELVEADARLESALDVLQSLADQIHIGCFKDARGHPAKMLEPLADADRLLERFAARENVRS
jgi:hypothetical protein